MELQWWLVRPWQLVPDEYKGWLLLAFLVVSTIALAYGFYLIATDKAFIINNERKGNRR